MKAKRFLTILLSVVMVLGMMPLTAFADEESCPHTNMVYSDEFGNVAATCFEPGVGGYYYCEDCGRYFDEDKENEYWEPLPAAKIPATGHYFNTDTGVCDECGLANPVYTKVTSLDDVNEEDMYIIVAEIAGTEGTQYFVLGGLYDRHPDEQGNIWCPDGATNAIRVTANADGSISLVDQEILDDGSPSEFMLDLYSEQFGDMSELGLTNVMLKLPNYCVYSFQSYSYDNNGYMGVPRYTSEYGMWDGSDWIIDFYTTEVTDDTYRYEDEFGSKTHAEQVADGNIDDNIAEGNLLLYKSSFYSVGGAMHTIRLRNYNGQYYFIAGEDWCLEGSDGWDHVTNTTPTNDIQYAVSLYRYDVPSVNTHTCEFGDWYDTEDGNHRRDCKETTCEKFESFSHDFGAWVKLDDTKHKRECDTCEAVETVNHNFTAPWTKLDATYHTHECKTEGCNATEKAAHTFGEWGEYAGFEGITRHCTADGCDAYEAKAAEPPHVCEFGDWMPDPSNDMKHIRTCECGERESGDHAYGEWTKKDENYHTHSCTICGAIEDFEHSFYDWIAKDDKDHVHECMECDYESVLPHDYVREVTKEPTEAEVGEATYTCSLCSHFYTEELPKRVSEVTNEDNNVSLSVPSSSNVYIPDGTVFDVVEMPTEQVPEQVLGEIAVTADGAAKPLGMYDLSLLLDGAKIQPDGTVEVTIPAPDLAAEYDKIIVVYIAPDGSYEECKTTVNEDGTITFETDHFSQYAVIGITPNTSPLVWILISAISVALIAGAVVAVVIIKKKKGIA